MQQLSVSICQEYRHQSDSDSRDHSLE